MLARPSSVLCLQFVASIMEVTVRDCAKRGQTGQAKGHLLSGLKPEECWLEYHTRVR